jgi:hypothetical protein
MLRQSCRESIFSCHGRIKADIQVLEVDTGYKIRYNEAADIGQSQVRKGRKMHEVDPWSNAGHISSQASGLSTNNDVGLKGIPAQIFDSMILELTG